jgi:hypothetical protein
MEANVTEQRATQKAITIIDELGACLFFNHFGQNAHFGNLTLVFFI